MQAEPQLKKEKNLICGWRKVGMQQQGLNCNKMQATISQKFLGVTEPQTDTRALALKAYLYFQHVFCTTKTCHHKSIPLLTAETG